MTGLELLRIYLNDHRAGAAAGKVTAHRCRRANRDGDLSRYLETLTDELDTDSDLLDEVRKAVQARPNMIKQSFGAVGGHLGRFKLNGRITGYSPLSRVAELEFLIVGVRGKLAMWQSLELLSPHLAVLQPFDFAVPRRRAQDQLDTLSTFHRQAVVDAFAEHTDG